MRAAAALGLAWLAWLFVLGVLAPPAFASSVQSPSAVSLSSTAAGASHVTYALQFTASATGGLPAQTGTITVAAPAGTDFAATASTGGAIVDDLTSGKSRHDFGPATSNAGATITVHVPVGVDIAAGDQVKVELDDVVNPPVGSGYSLSVSTSSDTTPAATATYAIGAASPPHSLSAVSLTSTAAGASHITYALQFTASATGGLVAQHGTITVVAPAGTNFSSTSGGELVDDLTTGHSDRDFGAAVSGGGATITVHVPIGVDINAGDEVELELDDVVNPPLGSGLSLSISTSSDTTAAATPTYSIGPAHAPQSLSAVSLSSSAAGASHVTYSLQFTASATGGLAAQHGTITVIAPAGTDFSSTSSGEVVEDLTTGHSDRDFGATVSGGGATITVHVPVGVDIAAGDQVKLELLDVVNPPVGSGLSLSVSTSSDTTSATTPTYSIGAAQAPQSLSAVTLSSSAAAASHVSYSFQFTASATGALPAQTGTITVAAPAGTDFTPGASEATVSDLTSGHSGTDFGASTSNGGATITVHVPTGVTIAAGDQVKLEVDDVTNAPAGSGYVLSVSTSSDTTLATTAPYALTAAQAPQSLSAVTLSSTAAGASHVTYSLQFTASSTGTLVAQHGTITVAAPTDTVFTAAGTGALVNDLTTGQSNRDFGPTISGGGATVTIHVPIGVDVHAGDRVSIELDDVVNPPAGSGYSLRVSTSSDTVSTATPTYDVGPPVVIGGPQPAVMFSPDHLAFAVTGVGASSAAHTVTLTNTGNAPLTIFALNFNGATTDSFTIARNDCRNATIAAGASCSLQLVFEPKDTGSHTDQLEFIDNAPGSPHTVPVTGTATGTGASLTGHVYDTTHANAPAAGALVFACSSSTCRQMVTGADGQYLLAGLPPGQYQAAVYPLSGSTVGLIQPTATVTLKPGPATQTDFLLTAPQPISGGVTFAGATSGTPRYFFGSPTTTEVKLQVPGDQPAGTLGVTLVTFATEPAGADPHDGASAATVGAAFVAYRYDAGRTPRFVSFVPSQALPLPDSSSPLGTWATSLSSAPSTTTDAQSLSVDGLLTPAADPYHGALTFEVQQTPYLFNTRGGGAERDRTALASGRAAAADELTEAYKKALARELLEYDVLQRLADLLAAIQLEAVVIHIPQRVEPQGCLLPTRPLDRGNGLVFLPNGGSWQALSNVVVLPNGVRIVGPSRNHPEVYISGRKQSFAPGEGVGFIAPLNDKVIINGPFQGTLATRPGEWELSDGNGAHYVFSPLPENGGQGTMSYYAPGSNTPVLYGARLPDPAPAGDRVPRHARAAEGEVPCPQPIIPRDFTGYADPSGTVKTTTGAPVPAARVVLSRSLTRNGPLGQVPNGSTVMSPANRRNPDQTTTEGHFGWDVLPGFYRVTASHAGCAGVRHQREVVTKILTVPPPVFDLRLVLRCPKLTRSQTATNLKIAPMPDNQLLLIAKVTGVPARARHPFAGTIVFTHGRRILGRVPVDPRRSTAVLTVTGSGARNHGIRARYEGDGYDAPSPPSPAR